MRKGWICLIAAFLVCASCRRHKVVSAVDYTVDTLSETVLETVAEDTLVLIEETEMAELPVAADEWFEDFIYDFQQKEKVRHRRVTFPLPCIAGEDTTWVTQAEWEYEPVFFQSDYYTVFYNNRKQMEKENHQSLSHVEVESYRLAERALSVLCFDRIDGKWFLTQKKETGMNGSHLHSFLSFYYRFVTDPVFEERHVEDPLTYVTSDPEDEFNVIEGLLDNDQWKVFKPQLPGSHINNIRYGQTYNNPNRMVMVKRGVANGLSETLTFQRKKGRWMLVSYEN